VPRALATGTVAPVAQDTASGVAGAPAPGPSLDDSLPPPVIRIARVASRCNGDDTALQAFRVSKDSLKDDQTPDPTPLPLPGLFRADSLGIINVSLDEQQGDPLGHPGSDPNPAWGDFPPVPDNFEVMIGSDATSSDSDIADIIYGCHF